MRVEDISFQDAQQNLDYDEKLLTAADKGGGEALRFWEPASIFVVLGRACRQEDEVDLVSCAQDHVAVLRRCSGGGTVIQSPGCLNFSLVLSKTRHPHLLSITDSYRHILSIVLAALRRCGVEAEMRPICDLVLAADEKKFSGNAQRRGRTHILHHGTILYDVDLSLMARYLRMPPKMPEYRKGRSHSDFVANVRLDVREFKQQLAAGL